VNGNRAGEARAGWSLVEMVVVLAIIAALAIWLVPRYLGGAKTPAGRTVSAPVQRARGVECANNLRQIRAAIQMAQTTTETSPGSLAELSSSGVPRQMLACPVSQQPYRYDPRTGRVGCALAEHRSY
jgi:prepilin-type N-terminal cleavage/methylation domain-containing protein